jgi:hypothetical protein
MRRVQIAIRTKLQEEGKRKNLPTAFRMKWTKAITDSTKVEKSPRERTLPFPHESATVFAMSRLERTPTALRPPRSVTITCDVPNWAISSAA